MSKTGKKLINITRNEIFVDRGADEQEKFADLTLRLGTIDSVLLLLDSHEEAVIINVLKHMVQQARRVATNISLLKEKHLLQLLLRKQFFRNHLNIFVRRLSLYLVSCIMENSNCLVELGASNLREIASLCLESYKHEDDDVCCEYLTVIVNKCLDDPQCGRLVLKGSSFALKCFSAIAATSDPDILLNSLEILLKLLLVQSGKEERQLVSQSTFPLNRLLCEISCELFEIRRAVSKVLHFLLLDPETSRVLQQESVAPFLLEQLVKVFCESSLAEELNLLVEVLPAAMQHEPMISLFFELNLSDKFIERVNSGFLASETACRALRVYAECAKCTKFLERLVSANITEKFLECLLTGDCKVDFGILLGLNRLMASSAGSKIIVDSCERGLLKKILKILEAPEIPDKAREQSAHLLENLLTCAFHKTSGPILDSNFLLSLTNVFSQNPDQRSTDLVVALLNIIEMLAGHSDLRTKMCKNHRFITGIGLLLKNSFSNAALAAHLIRCICCLVVEERTHDLLLEAFLCSSIKRALQSSSTQVKAAATNFIIQTTRFPKFMHIYHGKAVLEVLLLNQKRAFCVPTWQPAIESILAKSPTMKFCIRNSLDFVDITAGHDFMVSKRKFDDFRMFQCILREEVSPLHPVIVVNFNRPQNPEGLVVKVPRDCFDNDGQRRPSSENEWCYCRSPGDEFLPEYLQEVNSILAEQNLIGSSLGVQQRIDFDNVAKRAKVIAQVVERALGKDLKLLDLNTTEECCSLTVNSHLKELCIELHCSFIPLGRIRTGCKFERAILFKALSDQVGLPCTLQRSVDGRVLFNELALPLKVGDDNYCDTKTLSFMTWRMLRPTHIVDLLYNVGELYPLQSRQALQYLRLF